MTQHFQDCKTVAEVKTMYKHLCFEYHPDVSGYDSTETMQEINAEYLIHLKSLDGQVSKGFDGKDHTYKYDYAKEVGAMDTIDKLLQLELSSAVEIELLGSWVWVSGIVYKSEDQTKLQTLKHADKKRKDGQPAALMNWHGKRKRYYWRPDGYRKAWNPNASFDDLKSAYGSFKFEQEQSKGARHAAQPALIGAD